VWYSRVTTYVVQYIELPGYVQFLCGSRCYSDDHMVAM